MSDRDPLDDLLRQAFEADRARHPAVDLTAGVMLHIHRRRHLRTLILGAAATLGAAVSAVFAVPAVTDLSASLRGLAVPLADAGNGMLPLALTLAALAWLVFAEEEQA